MAFAPMNMQTSSEKSFEQFLDIYCSTQSAVLCAMNKYSFITGKIADFNTLNNSAKTTRELSTKAGVVGCSQHCLAG